MIVVGGVRLLASLRWSNITFVLSSFGRVGKINGCLLSAYEKFVSHNPGKRAVTSRLYNILYSRTHSFKLLYGPAINLVEFHIRHFFSFK